jgi:hypothetical protein
MAPPFLKLALNEGVTWTLSLDRLTIQGFGLVIGFIDHLQIVTRSNYSAIANSHTLQFTSLHFWHQSLPSNGFLRRMFPLLCSRTIPVPQLSASNSNSSRGLNCSNPLTNSLTNQLAPLHCTTLTELNSVCRVIQPRRGPHRKNRFQQYFHCCARAAAQ